jgi:hypothetical protein
VAIDKDFINVIAIFYRQARRDVGLALSMTGKDAINSANQMHFVYW